MNAALINPFDPDSTAIQPPAVEQSAAASLTLPASGAAVEPFAAQLGATAAETAATDPGRAVAADLIPQPVKTGEASNGGAQSPMSPGFCAPVEPAAVEVGFGQAPEFFHPTAPAGLSHNATTQAVEVRTNLEDELTHLIGVAGKRRRRPLALPRFAPDFPELWKAMHDKSAPRTVLDPLWADEPPTFLKMVR